MQILDILAGNEPGIIARIVGLLGRRGLIISNMSAKTCANSKFAQIRVAVSADAIQIERITRHLSNLIDVIEVKTHEHLSQTG